MKRWRRELWAKCWEGRGGQGAHLCWRDPNCHFAEVAAFNSRGWLAELNHWYGMLADLVRAWKIDRFLVRQGTFDNVNTLQFRSVGGNGRRQLP